MDTVFITNDSCRHCCGELVDVLDLGKIPIADDLIEASRLSDSRILVPLHLAFCPQCSLLQIREDVRPEIMFQETYPYHTGAIPQMVEHFAKASKDILGKLKLRNTATVIELACNDGTNLENYKQLGFNTIGIDPASEAVNIARKKGLRVYQDFFNTKAAIKYFNNEKADLLIGCNVLAHVPNVNTFVEGIAKVLNSDGVAVIEVPYAVDMIQKTEFDTIFHQHYSYFTLTSLSTIFSSVNLVVYDVEKIPVHGGSIRIFVSKKRRRKTKSLRALEQMEISLGVSSLPFYASFSNDVQRLKKSFMTLLNKIISEGFRVEGYGAAGKATTMISYFGITTKHINVIADINAYKQGKYFPGIKAPIVSPESLMHQPPSYIIIFCWNYSKQIIRQLEKYSRQGGKFIIPLPKPKII